MLKQMKSSFWKTVESFIFGDGSIFSMWIPITHKFQFSCIELSADFICIEDEVNS